MTMEPQLQQPADDPVDSKAETSSAGAFSRSLGKGSIAEQLANFNKTMLNSVETKVVYCDGRKEVVRRDQNGHEVVKERSAGELGYVGDVKEDLQVAEVLPGLIMGSQDVAHNMELLSKYGVTDILNVATLVINLYPYKFTYKNIEVLDIPEASILPFFNEAFDFIDKGRQRGCVLVHCNAGVSRSATFVIGYLMQKEHMSFKAALKFLKTRRPATNPNAGFVRQLQQFEQKLKTEQSKMNEPLSRSPPLAERKPSKYQKKLVFPSEEEEMPLTSPQDPKDAEETEKEKKQGFFKRLNSRIGKLRRSSKKVASKENDADSPVDLDHSSDSSNSSLEQSCEMEENEKNRRNGQQSSVPVVAF